jgi:hypothetical protein
LVVPYYDCLFAALFAASFAAIRTAHRRFPRAGFPASRAPQLFAALRLL